METITPIADLFGISPQLLVVLTVGTDVWVVCLNDPYPTPIIQDAVPGVPLKLIWYDDRELGQ